MSCNHEWSKECYDGPPSQICGRCNVWRIEEEQRKLVRDAYRRGAEAMREACEACVANLSHEDGLGMGSQRIEGALRALPIPEER